jgi:acetyltransferase
VSRHRLDPVLRPRAVAIVGASTNPSKRGYQAVRALQESDYPGAVYPVNPRGGEILGLPVHPSLETLPGPADLALVCTPASTAPDVVAACGRAGIPAAVLLAVGFGESGEEGARLSDAVLAAAHDGGVRLVGPNTSGLMNLNAGLNLIGARGVRRGGLGLLVQSGNLALNLMLDAQRRSSAGLSICVGVGNELDLGFADFLDALAHDRETDAVLLHAEGFRDGSAFLAAAAAAARRKPVVMLKAARSEASAEAARSHTGAVAGRYKVLRAGLRQAGVVEVARSDELFHVGEALAYQPPLAEGTGVALLSDGGGQGTLAVDLLLERGTPLAHLDAGTQERLRALLGPAAAVGNPVDLAGAADADPLRFAQALELLASDEGVGAVLVVGLFGGYGVRFDPALGAAEAEAAERMAAEARRAAVGLVLHTMYAPDATPPLAALRQARVPVIESLEVACRAVSALAERGALAATPPWRPLGRPGPVGAPAPGEVPRALSEPDARTLLQSAGIPLVDAVRCADAAAAVAAADRIGGAVVLKVVADGVAHKSDIGGVALDVKGEAEVRAAFDRVTEAARAHSEEGGDSGAGRVHGVLVSPHLEPPITELLVGVHHDPQVGPVLTVGAGGIWVESLGDVQVRVLPVDRDRIVEALLGLRIAPILGGARGRPVADLDAIVAAVQAMARLPEVRSDVSEAEVNPLFVYADRVVAVDARVYVGPERVALPGG